MIQRLQTIFLFISALAAGLFLYFPTWTKISSDEQTNLRLNAYKLVETDMSNLEATTVVNEQSVIYIAILAMLAMILALYSIFQFKNRIRQMAIGLANTLILAVVLGLSFYHAYQANQQLEGPDGVFLLGFFMIPVAMIANTIANRFIRKDEIGQIC